MKKLADFLVKGRYIILAVVVLLAIISGLLIPKINIVTDMTKFLPNDSQMRKGVKIMEDEFPDTAVANTVRVMFKNVPEKEKATLKTDLEQIKYVDSVNYEADDQEYNKGDYTLYILNIPYDYRSAEMNAVEKAVADDFTGTYSMTYSVDDTNGGEVPLWIMGLAFVIMMIILFLMCNSWVEPFLFLITIGLAIIINMGTNVILPQVSQITFSISALLQLVLSMDYSIILMNRYRQELRKDENRPNAMKKAITGAFSSIASSSVTTIVGLLALIFMSFKIGQDLGVVLAKGVLISLLCVLTVLPSLILLFDKAIHKTGKRVLHIPMGRLGRFSYKFRYPITVALGVLFIAMFLLQGRSNIVFTMPPDTEIDDVFPRTNAIVVLYENKDEKVIEALVPEIEQNKDVDSVMAYGNTLGKAYTATKMIEEMKAAGEDTDFELDSDMLGLIYYEFYKNGEIGPIKLGDFLTFVDQDIANNETFSKELDEESKSQLKLLKPFSSKEELSRQRSAEELAGLFGVDPAMINQLFAMTGAPSLSIFDFTQMLGQNQAAASSMTQESIAQMQMLQGIISGVMQDKIYTAKEMAELLSGMSVEMTESRMELLYTLYYSKHEANLDWTLTIPEMLHFAADDLANNPKYENFMDGDIKEDLNTAQDEVQDSLSQIRGKNHSLMIVNTKLPEESKGTTAFFNNLEKDLDRVTGGKYYLIGSSPMAFEMGKTFGMEQQNITLLTAFVIFMVVLLTFLNVLVPAILILLIQTAVYATTCIMNLQGMDINYLALLIVQSILMGATIDYAIVYVSYYRENRAKKSKKEAIISAYNDSIHTIMTSGLIMVLVTAVVGYAFEDPTIGQIVHTISKGAAVSILLIVFLLPGVLAVFDRWVCKDRFIEEKAVEKNE